jgi:hypothetical protein
MRVCSYASLHVYKSVFMHVYSYVFNVYYSVSSGVILGVTLPLLWCTEPLQQSSLDT